MWPVPDVNHVSGTDLLFLGGPGRNRTTDTRIFKYPRIGRLRVDSKGLYRQQMFIRNNLINKKFWVNFRNLSVETR